MKLLKTVLLLICLFTETVYGKGRVRIDTTPQNNTTEETPWTLQTELDYYHIPNQVNSVTGNPNPADTYYLVGSLGYTFKTGTTIAINTSNVPIAGGGAQNIESLSGVTLSQVFTINKYFDYSLGTNASTVFFGKMRMYNFDYTLLTYKITDKINIHGGAYYAAKPLSLTSNVVDYLVGFSYWVDKFGVEGDFVDGATNVSGSTLNFFFKNYYVGLLIPNRHSGNEFAGVGGIRVSF